VRLLSKFKILDFEITGTTTKDKRKLGAYARKNRIWYFLYSIVPTKNFTFLNLITFKLNSKKIPKPNTTILKQKRYIPDFIDPQFLKLKFGAKYCNLFSVKLPNIKVKQPMRADKHYLYRCARIYQFVKEF
jgi:hypothetical protein